MTKKEVNKLTYQVVGCAIEVHRSMGPGLLESCYEEAMKYELQLQGMKVENQVKQPVIYKGKRIKNDLKIDLLVNDLIIVELKAVELLLPIHKAQLLNYLQLAKKPKGLLINFNVTNIVEYGLIPMVNKIFEALPNS